MKNNRENCQGIQNSILEAIRPFLTDTEKSEAPQRNSVPVERNTRYRNYPRREDRESEIKSSICGKSVCNIDRREMKKRFSFVNRDGIK